MLPLILLLAALPASGTIRTGGDAILSFTTQQAEEAHWAQEPTAAERAATPAARIEGGARAALHCTADKSGHVTGCEIVAVQPERPDVRSSALSLIGRYQLDANSTQKAGSSRTPPVLWLQILFPDEQGRLPNDCHPAFGCIIEHMPPPLPPPPALPLIDAQ